MPSIHTVAVVEHPIVAVEVEHRTEVVEEDTVEEEELHMASSAAAEVEPHTAAGEDTVVKEPAAAEEARHIVEVEAGNMGLAEDPGHTDLLHCGMNPLHPDHTHLHLGKKPRLGHAVATTIHDEFHRGLA